MTTFASKVLPRAVCCWRRWWPVLGCRRLPAASWAASPAVERTEAFIAAFKKVKSGDKLTAADKKANEAGVHRARQVHGLRQR